MKKKFKKEEEKINPILNEHTAIYETSIPCQYTIDEIIANAKIAIKEF